MVLNLGDLHPLLTKKIAVAPDDLDARCAIFLIAYSRPELLRKTLKSINSAIGNHKYLKLIVWQTDSENYLEIKEVLEDFSEMIDYIFQIDGQTRNAIQNITHNEIIGLNYCFDYLKCSWVIALEEDTQIAYDALTFAESMLERYGDRRDFRSINMGSIEPRVGEMEFKYSILRFGPHLHSMVITRKVWRKYRLNSMIRRTQKQPLDALWGPYFYTGFVVTPNSSRSLDLGREGTHVRGPEMDFYFEGQLSSWMGVEPYETQAYRRQDLIHAWRAGSVKPYRRSHNFYYVIKKLILRIDEIFLDRAIMNYRTKRKVRNS